MSILVALKTPSALVLASDSRLTLQKTFPDRPPELCQLDWMQKLFIPGPPHPELAVGFYGDSNKGVRLLPDLLTEWARAQGQRSTVEEAARSLHAFIRVQDIPEVCLLVAGYDATSYYGRVFQLMPGGVSELQPNSSGVVLGGQKSVAEAVKDRLTLPLDAWPVQAGVAFARFLVRTEIDAQAFNLAFAGTGGDTQVAVLERGMPARKETIL